MTDYRALITEMADELDHNRQCLLDDRRQRHPLADHARAALAEADGPAVPEGREPASVATQPSDRELLELMPETMRDEFAYAAKICSEATGGQVKPGIFRVCLNTAALEYARAVLARWGRPAAAPVPVSERLPGPEDCDEQGRCWVHQPVDYSPEAPTWQLLFHKYASANYGTTAWLPANALPPPAPEGEEAQP